LSPTYIIIWMYIKRLGVMQCEGSWDTWLIKRNLTYIKPISFLRWMNLKLNTISMHAYWSTYPRTLKILSRCENNSNKKYKNKQKYLLYFKLSNVKLDQKYHSRDYLKVYRLFVRNIVCSDISNVFIINMCYSYYT